jgi:hypothetical protein
MQIATNTRSTAYSIRSATHPPYAMQQTARAACRGGPFATQNSIVCADDRAAVWCYAMNCISQPWESG